MNKMMNNEMELTTEDLEQVNGGILLIPDRYDFSLKEKTDSTDSSNSAAWPNWR